MKVIGLTGGIGSGKSTVSQRLAELGAVIIDADKVGHEVLKSREVVREVVAAFGRQVITPDGDIDRKKLGKAVFRDAESLSRLNQIMHPRIYERVKTRIEEYRRQGVDVVVLEAPLLLEGGWTSLVDEVWVTVAPQAAILKRLQERSGLSQPDSLARIHLQLTSAERLKHADVVIDNSGSLEELKSRIMELWQNLHA